MIKLILIAGVAGLAAGAAVGFARQNGLLRTEAMGFAVAGATAAVVAKLLR